MRIDRLCVSVLFLLAAGSAEAQSFQVVEPPTGWTITRALDFSGDGRLIIGQLTRYHPPGIPEYRNVYVEWRSSLETRTFESLPAGYWVADASRDGSVLLGGTPESRLYRWTDAGIELLPEVMTAGVLSADGKVVVGRGYRWKVGEGLSTYDLESLEAISADGERLVGRRFKRFSSPTGGPWWEANDWIAPGPVRSLGFLDMEDSAAIGVSADGSTAVGYARQAQYEGDAYGSPLAVRFTAVGPRVLTPLICDSCWSNATHASADGSRIVGWHQPDSSAERVFVWDRFHGMMDLVELLNRLGVGTSGWWPQYVTGISEDGTVIVGNTNYPSVPRIFIAVIPTLCPADLDADGVVDFTDFLSFLNLFEAQDSRADFVEDGVVDFGDYLEFLNLFDAGC